MAFAFIFNDVGVGEWFVLLAVVLVVVGPKRLPETARNIGRWYSRMRRAADSFKRQLMDMDTDFESTASSVETGLEDAFTVEPDPGPEEDFTAAAPAAAADAEGGDADHKES